MHVPRRSRLSVGPFFFEVGMVSLSFKKTIPAVLCPRPCPRAFRRSKPNWVGTNELPPGACFPHRVARVRDGGELFALVRRVQLHGAVRGTQALDELVLAAGPLLRLESRRKRGRAAQCGVSAVFLARATYRFVRNFGGTGSV